MGLIEMKNYDELNYIEVLSEILVKMKNKNKKIKLELLIHRIILIGLIIYIVIDLFIK